MLLENLKEGALPVLAPGKVVLVDWISSAITQRYFLPVLFTVQLQRGPLSFYFSFKNGFNH